MRGTKALTGCERDAATDARVPLRVALFLLARAAPAVFAQQADTFDAEWSRITSGAETSSGGEFTAEATIGVPEGAATPAGADTFDVSSGFVAGTIPEGMKMNEIFLDGYE